MGPEGLEDWKRALWGASHRAVRVMQALRAGDPGGVRGFYEALITQSMAAYNAGRPPFADLEGALVAAGLAPSHAAAAADAAWDEGIRRSPWSNLILRRLRRAHDLLEASAARPGVWSREMGGGHAASRDRARTRRSLSGRQ